MMLAIRVPEKPRSIQISGLFRELIIAAAEIGRAQNANGLSRRNFPILSLLLEELAASPDAGISLPVAKDQRLVRLCSALRADPADNRSLDEWSKTIGASARTLSRSFQKELSCSFIVWRQQLRVFSAIARLSAGEPVTQVAHAVGYDTHGAFSAVFRKITGLNPASYFPGKDGAGESNER